MTSLKDIFNPEYNEALKQLKAEYKDLDHSLLEEAAIAAHTGDSMCNIELKLKDSSDKEALLETLTDVRDNYSNRFTIYGKRKTETGTESVIQLTLKDPCKILELHKKDYVANITSENLLPTGSYMHMNDVSNVDDITKLEAKIDAYMAKAKDE